jgi:hypothetical protein
MTSSTTTRTQAHEVAAEALERATDYGTRHWLRAPRVEDNAYGGTDITQDGRLYRTAQADTDVILYVMTANGVLQERAEFSKGLAHLAAALIAEALR